MATEKRPNHDVSSGWCACGEYHAAKSPECRSAPSKKGIPGTLPCGCRVNNAQGATIAGRYAHTKLLPDGIRECRCGRRWRKEISWSEVVPTHDPERKSG